MEQDSNSILKQDLKNHKRKKLKKLLLYYALSALAVAVVVLLLLFHSPANYNSPEPISGKEVSPYLTNVLSPQFYNGIQLGEPFDVVVTQEGINDIVRRLERPLESDGIKLSALEVFFVPKKILLMGTVIAADFKLIITVELKPIINKQGLLDLHSTKVKAGALNITFLAGVVAKKIYKSKFGKTANQDDYQVKIALSLLEDRPFEPIFKISDKNVRLEKISVADKTMTLHMLPLPD